jgi:hypothetical protein
MGCSSSKAVNEVTDALGECRLFTKNANYSGDAKVSGLDLHGNGALGVNDTELFFRMWVGNTAIRMPISSVTGCQVEPFFNGRRAVGCSHLVINCTSVDGSAHSHGFMMKTSDAEQWSRELGQLAAR